MIRHHDCYEVACDTPDCDMWATSEHETPLFDSPEEAIGYVVAAGGSHIDGFLRCHQCAAAHQCEQDGHEWGAGELLPGVSTIRQRCERCLEDRLLAMA
ncbi:hypothetical protein ABZ249_30205 [Nocardiopsis sp. NPDC006139]|uniref:hypothetical protein n=1 Tax=Nocardiopsis sp. NPDC006139 TaxID=3154578 RepID=UPI00339DE93E